MPRLRQAVLTARDLDSTVTTLRERFGLGEPYHDPGVAQFGLTNAVFAIGDTFLEVVSPTDTSVAGAATAARQLERSGSDVSGYMAMIQVADLASARARAEAQGVREVFAVEFDDMAEVHLHPGDVRGALVSLSEPKPPESWCWGGEGWERRAVPGRLVGIDVAIADPDTTARRWAALAGGEIPGVSFGSGQPEGIVAIELELRGAQHVIRPRELLA
jgi:hypothetical protein